MAISADSKAILNKYAGWGAAKAALGDLIEAAESVIAGEIALADGKVLVGNGSNVAAAVSLSGDVTNNNAGVVTIANSAVSAAKLASDAVTTAKILDANVTLAKLASDSVNATKIVDGSVSDSKLAANSVVNAKIANDAVNADKIADDAVSLEHLDSGIEYSHRVFAAGEFTTAGGDTSETIVVAGALATDLALVQSKSGNAVVVRSAAGAGDITVTLDADPGNDDVLTYVLLRAAT